MMSSRLLFAALAAFLLAATAAAQPRPIFDSDDFVDPRQHDGPVFLTRAIVGVARNLVDDYRPLGQDAAFLQLANSVYWNRWQFDYKHSEVRGEHDAPPLVRCGCNPPLYFPTPPPPNATPLPPPPGPRDTVQFGFYRPVPGGPAAPPIMLRTQFTVTRQHLGTEATSFTTGEVVERRSGHEQSFGLDADTHFRIREHDVWGSVAYAYTSRSGTSADRVQQGLTYTARPPGWALGRVLARATLTVGGVSNRGGTAINVVNPAFEAFFHSQATKANLRAIWSPTAWRDSAGWKTRHQIALLVEYVHLWR
jgi:hypothetical protein